MNKTAEKFAKGFVIAFALFIFVSVVILNSSPSGQNHPTSIKQKTPSVEEVILSTPEEEKSALEDFYKNFLQITEEADSAHAESLSIAKQGNLIASYAMFQNHSLPAFKKVQTELQNMKIPNISNEENKRQLEEGVKEVLQAYSLQIQGINQILKGVDENKNSLILKGFNQFEESQEFIISGAGKITWILNLEYGIEVSTE